MLQTPLPGAPHMIAVHGCIHDAGLPGLGFVIRDAFVILYCAHMHDVHLCSRTWSPWLSRIRQPLTPLLLHISARDCMP